MTKFPYCCAALQNANECDMVCIEKGEISWFNKNKEVITVRNCPFCGDTENDVITVSTQKAA